MGFILDSILQKNILEGPETVNADFTSESLDISGAESDFAVTLDYINGSSVDMNLYLQISTDNVVFADITGSEQAITDITGTHIWDVSGTGGQWIRVRVVVNTGSIDIDNIRFDGKRRH